MVQFLPPPDERWETVRPTYLTVLTVLSYVLLLGTIWVQTNDPEIVAASADPELGLSLQPGPSLVTIGLLGLVYAVPLALWWLNVPYMLYLMTALCILGAVVFLLSTGTGLLWNWRVGVVPLAGVVINLAWLLVAHRRDRF